MLASEEGFIDIIEGEINIDFLFTTGFAYGRIPITVSTLTYSQYEARGFSLADNFDADETPADAADGMLWSPRFLPRNK